MNLEMENMNKVLKNHTIEISQDLIYFLLAIWGISYCSNMKIFSVKTYVYQQTE